MALIFEADFLTHDQQDTWPKYLVLNEKLVDKLELVIDDVPSRSARRSARRWIH